MRSLPRLCLLVSILGGTLSVPVSTDAHAQRELVVRGNDVTLYREGAWRLAPDSALRGIERRLTHEPSNEQVVPNDRKGAMPLLRSGLFKYADPIGATELIADMGVPTPVVAGFQKQNKRCSELELNVRPYLKQIGGGDPMTVAGADALIAFANDCRVGLVGRSQDSSWPPTTQTELASMKSDWLDGIRSRMVAIMMADNMKTNWTVICSGTLIDSRTVLTAQHCTMGRAPQFLAMHADQLQVVRFMGSGSHEVASIERKTESKYFSEGTERGDYALLILKRPTQVTGLDWTSGLPSSRGQALVTVTIDTATMHAWGTGNRSGPLAKAAKAKDWRNFTYIDTSHNCRVTMVSDETCIRHACTVEHSGSGAALYATAPSGPKLIAVHHGAAARNSDCPADNQTVSDPAVTKSPRYLSHPNRGVVIDPVWIAQRSK